MVTKICLYCNTEFHVAQYRENSALYCSQKCKWNYEYEFKKQDVICQVCSKEFKVILCRKNTAKYCSRKCFYIAMNQKGTIVKKCKFCEKEIRTSPSKNKMFCSRECLLNYGAMSP